MIREKFRAFAARLTDAIYSSRNRARIVIGTDRKDTKESGFGDGGQNDPDSSAIDIVAGFDGDSEDPSFSEDKSRIYLSGKSNPDEYIQNEKGESVQEEASIITVSDNIYLKSRNKIKILNDNYSIVCNNDGTIEIECNETIQINGGENKIKISRTGIELDCSQGLSGKIITDNDICVGIDPVSGSPILSNFKSIPQGALVNNQKVVIK